MRVLPFAALACLLATACTDIRSGGSAETDRVQIARLRPADPSAAEVAVVLVATEAGLPRAEAVLTWIGAEPRGYRIEGVGAQPGAPIRRACAITSCIMSERLTFTLPDTSARRGLSLAFAGAGDRTVVDVAPATVRSALARLGTPAPLTGPLLASSRF